MTRDVSRSAFPSALPLGQLLRHWRRVRRFSQLELASEAGISTRHLSFLETGRSRASREMVQRLAAALDLPLAEQSALLVAAGYVPANSPGGSAAEDLQPVQQALDFILRQQDPYPGLVLDSRWDVIQRNNAAARVFEPFRSAYRMPSAFAGNAMHMVFHPQGLRPFITNWSEFSGRLIQILHREVAHGHRAAAALLDEISTYPGSTGKSATMHPAAAESPMIVMRLRKDNIQLAFFSTFTTFAMPASARLQTLKIECLYPADRATAVFARELAGECQRSLL